MANGSTAARFPLGSLEQAIMEIIWHGGPVTVRDVHVRLQRRHPCAYTTVMTVMGRLVRKRLLKRSPLPSGAYRYESVQPAERFAAVTTRRVIDSLLARFGDVAVAQFVDVLDDVSPAKLRRLQEALKKNRYGKR